MASKESPADKLNRFRKENAVFYWRPYKWQERLLEMVRKKSTTAAISSNKIGKCLTYDSLVETPNGEIPIGRLFDIGKPFDVYAWNGEKKVIVKAHSPIKKEWLHKCYRVTMSDGRWFEGADHHRILTTSGSYISLENIYAFFHEHQGDFDTHDNGFDSSHVFPLGKVSASHCMTEYSSSPVRSSSEFSPLGRFSDVRRLFGKSLGYLDGYLMRCRQYGVRLHSVLNNALTSFPLQADALTHNALLSGADGQGYICKDTFQPSFCHPSNSCDLLHPSARFFESVSQSVCANDSVSKHGHQEFLTPSTVANLEPRSNHGVDSPNQDTLLSYCPPLCIDDNNIISIDFVGVNSVYDFTVPKYHNYCAGGIVHHNTAAVCNILVSWMCGYEPWQEVDKDEEGAVDVGGTYFRVSSLGIKPPVNLILTGEDWKAHIGRSLLPELKKWMPVSWCTTKKNEQGVEYYWKMYNGSTLTIMSYSQDDDLFESFRIQGVVMDEPPPKSKYVAMSRGLLLDRGKTLLSLTPLKEAWILDEVVLSGRKDIGIVDNLKITDNPDLLSSDVAVLEGLGFDEVKIKAFFRLLLYSNFEKKVPVQDKGHASIKYLEDNVPIELHEDFSKLKILKFIQDIDPDDVPPRVFGQFKSLVGRVLKQYDKDIHVVAPFKIPTDWPVVAMIDFHLSTPQAVSFWTVNKQDIHFCIGEIWDNINGDQIADEIIRKKNANSWDIKDVFIDPLSKGDTQYMKNRLGSDLTDTYSIIDEKLSTHGITLHVASKDKESGVKNLQTMLKGVNNLPNLFIFDTCERFQFEVQRWVFDDEGKPSKDCSDHFMENAYRYTLVGNTYDMNKIKPLPVSDGHTSSSSMWMAA